MYLTIICSILTFRSTSSGLSFSINCSAACHIQLCHCSCSVQLAADHLPPTVANWHYNGTRSKLNLFPPTRALSNHWCGMKDLLTDWRFDSLQDSIAASDAIDRSVAHVFAVTCRSQFALMALQLQSAAGGGVRLLTCAADPLRKWTAHAAATAPLGPCRSV